MSSTDFLPFPLPSLSLISSKICEEFLRGKRGKLGQGEIPIRVVMGPLLLPKTFITENIPLFCIKPEKKLRNFFRHYSSMRETEKGCGDKNVFMPPTCIRALSHEILLRKCRKISSYTLYELMYIPLAWSLSFKARAREFEYIVKKPRSLTLLYTTRRRRRKKRNTGTA